MIRKVCEESSRGYEDQIPTPEAAYTCIDVLLSPEGYSSEPFMICWKSCVFPSAFRRLFFAVHVLHLFLGAEFSVINRLLHFQVVLL